MSIRNVAVTNTLEEFRTTFNSLGTDVGDITEFKNLQLKIVMKSSNTVFIPKLKDLRVIAYS